MKILLDHNLDRRLKRYLTEYQTATTQEQGWTDLLNGELLKAAENEDFTVLLTADSNLKNQQNMTGRTISVLVLRASNNRLFTHAEMVTQMETALDEIRPGQVIEIFHPTLMNRD